MTRNLKMQSKGPPLKNTTDLLISTSEIYFSKLLRMRVKIQMLEDLILYVGFIPGYRIVAMISLYNTCSVHVREGRRRKGSREKVTMGEKKTNQCYQIRSLLFQLHLTLITSPKAQGPDTDTLGLNTPMAVDMSQGQFHQPQSCCSIGLYLCALLLSGRDGEPPGGEAPAFPKYPSILIELLVLCVLEILACT